MQAKDVLYNKIHKQAL